MTVFPRSVPECSSISKIGTCFDAKIKNIDTCIILPQADPPHLPQPFLPPPRLSSLLNANDYIVAYLMYRILKGWNSRESTREDKKILRQLKKENVEAQRRQQLKNQKKSH